MMSKIVLISRVLDHFYPAPPIPLNHFDNFTLLVSVVLSAQTTDGKVNEVTKVLFDVAPTPQLMSAMEASEIQKIIQTVGLAPKKSVYLKTLSQKLIDVFDGEVPSTYENLESLPGVGHKTASVVMSQAFGESALAVDTHVHRLSLRWGLSAHDKNVDKVQLDLHRQFPEEHWNKIHLQMIYFGREYCTAKLHTSSECPMCSWVNKKNGEPAISFADFTPKKKSKGIVFYDDRMIELVDSPELARGAILFSPVKAERKVLPVGEEMMTPPTKKRGSKALKLQQIKVKTEVGDVAESIVSPVAMTTPSRLKRVKKELVVEAIQTLTLDFSSPQPNIIPKKTKPRAKKIKTEDIGLINALVMSEGSLTPDTVTAAISDNESGSVKVTKRMTRASGRKGGDVEKIK